jgi:predicted phage terminase large subunit-like protein
VGRIHALCEAGGDPWTVIRLPALAEADDPLGRNVGEALWPERYDEATLERTRQELELNGQGYIWECQYMQNPIGDPGLIEWPDSFFRNIMYDDLPPSLNAVCHVVSVDPSKGSDSKAGDPAAVLSVLKDERGHLWVDDGVIRGMTTDQIEDTALSMMVAGVHGCIVESNHFQEMIANNMLKKRPGAPVYKHVSTDNKEVRIRIGLTPLLAQGMVHIRNRPFGQILKAHMRSFPTGAHDDGPDALDLAKRLIDKLLTKKSPQPQRRVLQVR